MRSGVARDILYESKQNYDLLVVGRTGISKIDHITLGSVASKLVDVVAHPPVIVGGENTKSKKLLIAIDGSTGSMKAVRCAGTLLDSAECEILTYQTGRAAVIVKTATKGGYDTIVLGRRGLTAVGEFKIGRVSRKILQFAYRSTLWIVS
jgi:nucleotide-binding universal stress UspA family protein